MNLPGKLLPFKKKKLHQLEQRLVILMCTSFKPISCSQCKFEMSTNPRINELEKAQKHHKCYSIMMEKQTVKVQMIIEQLNKKLSDILTKEQNPGRGGRHHTYIVLWFYFNFTFFNFFYCSLFSFIRILKVSNCNCKISSFLSSALSPLFVKYKLETCCWPFKHR